MNISLNQHRRLRIIFILSALSFFCAMGLGLFQSIREYHRLPPINSHYMPEITSLIENEDYGMVIPQLELASKIDPADTEKNNRLLTNVCCVAAQSLIKKRRFKEAIIQYDKAYVASPDAIDVQNNFAWLLATCPDGGFRDAIRAMKLAERAAQKTRYVDPSMLDTLAAAYAESGAFDKAVDTQRKAIALTPVGSRDDLQKRLDLYLAGQAYHSY